MGRALPSAHAPARPVGVARLSVVGLSKQFAATRALDDVSIEIAPGQIHAVIGQNGSGKSTLVKVLSGYHRPTSGTVSIDGTVLPLPFSPRVIRRRGLAVVHQDLGLIGDQSVAENIRVGDFRSRFRIRWRAESRLAQLTLERLGADIDVRVAVSSLGPADRAMVAIARAMQTDSIDGGLILFDESTRALPRGALPGFYRTLRSVCARGGSILLITHQLPEVLAVADRVSVLRNGRVVADDLPTSGTSEGELARLMIGKDLHELVWAPAARNAAQSAVEHSFDGVRGAGVQGVDLVLRAGEVVGVTGRPGSGYEQLPYLLTGAAPATAGTYRTGSRSVALPHASPRRLMDAGVALVPERRLEDGLAIDLSVADNLTLPRLRTKGRRYAIGEKWRASEVRDAIDTLGITPDDPDALLSQLSGGNQQKVLMAKWLMNRPNLLVLHEPTQGVDVGARVDLLKVVLDVSASGNSVLVCSGEPDDLVALCDRVLVLKDGRVGEQLCAPFTVDELFDAVYGHASLPPAARRESQARR